MIAHVNHCSVLTAECDFTETPGGVYIVGDANRTMHGKVISAQPNQSDETWHSRGPIRRAELTSFPWWHPIEWPENSSGRGNLRVSWLFTLACIVCASSNCDAVIRRPGRIWGVWESHERNDAMLGNQFLAGDNTSRIRTCFIKQCWL